MSFRLGRTRNARWKPKSGEARVKNYVRTHVDGVWFDSKLEAARYQELRLMEKAGLIKIMKLQDHVYLSDARILYIADFKIHDLELNEEVWEETKGFENDRWPIIKKLWKSYGPGRLRIYKGSYKSLRMTEEIIPKGEIPKVREPDQGSML